jgi:hypothetical protein
VITELLEDHGPKFVTGDAFRLLDQLIVIHLLTSNKDCHRNCHRTA